MIFVNFFDPPLLRNFHMNILTMQPVKVESCILASLILVQYFRESSKKNSGDLMRSRTRENNVYVEGEEE